MIEPVRQGEPRAGGIDVVVLPFLQDLPLEGALALNRAIHRAAPGSARHGAHAAHVLVAARARRDRAPAVHAQRADGQRIGARQLIELENVDRGIARQRARIDGEEKPAGLVIEVAGLAIDRLAGDVADAVEPVFHHVALLLRQDAAELQRPQLGDRLHAEIVGGDRGGDEPRRRRLERHVAGLDSPQDFVLQALVPDVEVVVGVELALAVEVDVDVQPLPHDTGGADRVLRIGTDRGKAAAASRQRKLPLLRRAAQIAELIHFQLEAQVELHAEIRILAKDAAMLAGTDALEGRRSFGGRGRGDGGRGECHRSGSEHRKPASENRVSPGARDEHGRDARAEAAARRQCRMARRDERRHAERVRRSLRMNPGYDEREGEQN